MKAIERLRSRRPGRSGRALGLRLCGGVAIAITWEIAGRSSDSLLLPSCLETVRALARLAWDGELWRAFWSSNQALVAGFALAVGLGIPAGLGLGAWPRAGRWADPYVHGLLVIPTTALVPLLLIAGGVGFVARVLVVFAFALPVIVQCARAAIRQIDPRLRDVARVFGATPRQEWWRVILPAAVPGLVAGVRLGLSRAVEGMIVVELLLAAVGLGGLILEFQGRFDAPGVYAVIVVVVAEAALLTHLGRVCERRLAPQAAGRD